MRFRKLKKQSKQTKTSKHSNVKTLPYARISDKIKAFITDMFMIYMPILYIITYVIMGGKDAFQASNIAPLLGVSMYGIIYSLFIMKSGQTPGKKAYTIKVVDSKTLKNLSFIKAFISFFVFLLSATFLIGLIFPFFRKDRKSIHDLVCNTVEIEVEK
jgi:uncharacterized RDD family membrane protein YckC